ncbi:MAG TPA: GNAT family N-acetyltransferase [Bacteroidota bacterium]|nr:GNAT family N-acetyltransferase [Bacteroidota bacterium]
MRAGTDVLIALRPLEARDRGPLEAILRATGVFSEAEIGVALELIDSALGNPAQKDYIIRTAEGDRGEVAGYYCVGPTPMTAGTWDLYWIAVSPVHRGMDIGKTLLRHAEDLVQGRGGRLIIAETSSKPSYDGTNRFYVRNSYCEMARIRNYYEKGDDLVVYGKYFS